jgi:hypothetical protein
MSGQTGWRWCRKCEGLFFAGNPSQGVCAADIGPHDPNESGAYVIDLSDSAVVGQNLWRWCSTCQGLFFVGGGTLGRCPAGGSHTSDGSGDYILHQQPTGLSTQAGWRWCRDCQGMYFGGGSGGVCPAGAQHSAEGSGDYVLRFEGGGEVEALSAGRENMLGLIGKWMPTSLAQPRVPPGETQDLMARAGWTMARGIQSKKDKDAGKPPVTSCGDILSAMLRLWHSNFVGAFMIRDLDANGHAPGAKGRGFYVEADGVRVPKLGDILVLRNGVGKGSAGSVGHVGILVEAGKTIWRTADGGGGVLPDQTASVTQRTVRFENGIGILKSPTDNKEKQLDGWVDLDKLKQTG